MALFNFARYYAYFIDSKGQYVGKKVIRYSMIPKGTAKTKFIYDNGAYNLKENAFKIEFSPPAIFFKNYIYVYEVGIPDPLEYKNLDFKILINPKDYQVRMRSNLVKELNRIGMGTNINWRYILIGLVALGIAYFVFTGGLDSIIHPASQEVVNNASVIGPRVVGGG